MQKMDEKNHNFEETLLLIRCSAGLNSSILKRVCVLPESYKGLQGVAGRVRLNLKDCTYMHTYICIYIYTHGHTSINTFNSCNEIIYILKSTNLLPENKDALVTCEE